MTPNRRKNIRFFLLRGLARETRHWGEFPHILTAHDDSNYVFHLEIPGAGKLNYLPSPIKIADYIPPLREQYLPHFQEGDTHILVGVSLGGMISASWVSSYLDDFQGVAMINCSGSQSPFFSRLLPYGAWKLTQTLLGRSEFETERLIIRLICNIQDPDSIASKWAEIRRTAPISRRNSIRQLIAAWRFAFPIELGIPALFLCSKNDRLVSFQCSQTLSTLLCAPILYHETAGHDLSTDDPEWCSAALFNWAESIR